MRNPLSKAISYLYKFFVNVFSLHAQQKLQSVLGGNEGFFSNEPEKSLYAGVLIEEVFQFSLANAQNGRGLKGLKR